SKSFLHLNNKSLYQLKGLHTPGQMKENGGGIRRRVAKANQRKRRLYDQKLEEQFDKDKKIRKLESEKALLTIALRSATRKLPIPVTPRYSLPKSVLDRSRSKASAINQTLRVSVTEFNKRELQILPGTIGSGAYGSLKIGKLPNFQQSVAVKEIT
uniref:Uncharacterized protein n=1 Tax=Clytia hemisphaerica TaxID=252671 RepID=A0A7M5XCZ1_9CNID